MDVDFEDVALSIPHTVFVASPEGLVAYFNRFGSEYVGVDGRCRAGWDWVSLVHPDDADPVRHAWEAGTHSQVTFTLECRIRRADGQFRWHTVTSSPARGTDGHGGGWIGTAIDIENQRRLEETLHRSQREAAETVAQLEALHSASPVGFGFVDRDLRLIRANEVLATVNGAPIRDQLDRRASAAEPKLWPQMGDLCRRVLDTGERIVNREVSGRRADDPEHAHRWLATYYPVRVHGEIIGIGIIAVDITERRQAETVLAAVMDNMVEGLYAIDRDGRVTFANASGVELLGWTEDELRGQPLHSVVHYQRADGSAISDADCDLLKVRSEGRTIRMADDAFTHKDGTILPVAYSAAPLVDGAEIDGAVVVFRDTTEERADQERIHRELDSLSWVGRIREALDEDRLVLYSQPIVPLRAGQPSEELLVRMIGRSGEVILPGSFVPVAEKYGMISEIDRWVVGQAAHIAAQGRRVEANVSAQSIAPLYLLPIIEHELDKTGADPANLVLEITETALMQNVHAGEVFAQGLAQIGCGLSLDDFGTGFASFTYLKRLPLRSLKIDIEFVHGLESSTADQHIVQSIVQLARGFQYDTIAEGVEDDTTLSLLRHFGVDYAQGYLLGAPAPLDA